MTNTARVSHAIQNILNWALSLKSTSTAAAGSSSTPVPPKRRRVALDAITAMDGWIYLMAAGKAETGVIADLREIREEGHNLHGVVCISKVNLLNDPTASKSLDELAHAQKDMFQQYSAMPITYDSAMARAQFGLIRETAVGSDEDIEHGEGPGGAFALRGEPTRSRRAADDRKRTFVTLF